MGIGGVLELPKCGYHFIYWDFLQSGRPSLQGGQVGQAMKLHDGNGQSITIECKSNYVSHKTLGCYIKPQGSEETSAQKDGKFLPYSGGQCAELKGGVDLLFCHLSPEHWVHITFMPLHQGRT